MKVVVGSRGSHLALTQTKWVIDQLKAENPTLDFEIKVIKTKGDRILDVTLDKIGDKGLFVKEIEQALLDRTIDMAIHSMKDMPSEIPDGLKFAALPKREDVRDVLILREGLRHLDDVPLGGKIGTGSKRRKYQLLKVRPDLQIVPIRGNVETRIKKIETEGLDGIVLAAAGIHRVGLHKKIDTYLSPEKVLPAPAQGALAIEIRQGHDVLEQAIEKIKDEETTLQVKAERAFLKGVNGSCHIPIGALCLVEGENLRLDALFGTADGSKLVRKSMVGKVGEEEGLGLKLAKAILKEMESDDR